jgi:hypothetical protein
MGRSWESLNVRRDSVRLRVGPWSMITKSRKAFDGFPRPAFPSRPRGSVSIARDQGCRPSPTVSRNMSQSRQI